MWLLLSGLLSAQASTAIRSAAVFHDDQPHGQVESIDPSVHVLSWPFCPSYQVSCQELAWVEIGVSVDAYVARRNGPHAQASELIATSQQDLEPLARALEAFFTEQGITSDAVKVGYVQGISQSLDYHLDAETGWTEYPKYAVEMLVDEQGDCDDAAILMSALLLELGYTPYLMRWRKQEGPGGHLSTALLRSVGDLSSVEPPAGSPLIEGPEGRVFLHVDGTGTIGGCTRGCTDLGWNGWLDKGMVLEAVVAADDPLLDSDLPLRAWNNDNHFFPSRQTSDRRGADPEDILRQLERWDWEERTLRRLERLGREEPEQWLQERRPSPVGDSTWLMLSGAMGLGLLSMGVVAFRARQRRLAHAERLAAERRKQEF
ncbi:MAG: hypothetical protein VX899_24220 [Myxococcota bacterium]|nr:hypothetical protein [Myxococcota bacterium]